MNPSKQTAMLAVFDKAALAMQKEKLDADDIAAIRALFFSNGGNIRDLIMSKDAGLVRRLQDAIEQVTPPAKLTGEKREIFKAGAVAVIGAINGALRVIGQPQLSAPERSVKLIDLVWIKPEAVSAIKDHMADRYAIESVQVRPLWAKLLEIVTGLTVEEQQAIVEQAPEPDSTKGHPATAVILDAFDIASRDASHTFFRDSIPPSVQAFFTLHGDVLRDILAKWKPNTAAAVPTGLESGCVGIALHTLRETRAFVTGNAASRIDAAIAQIERLTGEGGAG